MGELLLVDEPIEVIQLTLGAIGSAKRNLSHTGHWTQLNSGSRRYSTLPARSFPWSTASNALILARAETDFSSLLLLPKRPLPGNCAAFHPFAP